MSKKKSKKKLDRIGYMFLKQFHDMKYPVCFPIDSRVFPDPVLSKNAGIFYGFLQHFGDECDLEADGWILGSVDKEGLELIGKWMNVSYKEVYRCIKELFNTGWIDFVDSGSLGEEAWQFTILANPIIPDFKFPKFRTPMYMFNK